MKILRRTAIESSLYIGAITSGIGGGKKTKLDLGEI